MTGQLAGWTDLAAAPAPGSALLLLGCQEAYRGGDLAVPGVDAALRHAGSLLRRARSLGVPVLHVRQHAEDMIGDGLRFADATTPAADEEIVDARRPDAFADTDLGHRLRAAGVGHVVLAGFLTHLAITATARAATRRGLAVTVVEAGTGTRSVPGTEWFCPPEHLQRAVLDAVAVGLGEVVPDVDSVVWSPGRIR